MKNYKKQFGGKIDKEVLDQLNQSENWKKGKFRNLERTAIDINLYNLPKLIKKQIFDKKGRYPEQKLPIIKFDKDGFLKDEKQAKFIWYGHAVVLIRLNGLNILIDPMFGNDTAPVAPFASKRFSENTLQIIDELPEIDILLLTHDHYDHLDLDSMMKLKSKVKNYIVSLGSKRHFDFWEVSQNNITELDWWQSKEIGGIKFTFTPTRHSAGRGINDRDQTLWGGWLMQAPKETLYFSGDGGFGKHFKEIGNYAKSIDFAFMECGQYNKMWHQIHMHPEETVQATLNVNAKKAMPYHWAGFALALHHWKEPIERFTAEATTKNLAYITPKLGEIVNYAQDKVYTKWWESYE